MNELVFTCVQMSRDRFNDFINLPELKGQMYAYKLDVFESYRQLDKKMSRALGKERFADLQESIAENSDALEQYVKPIRNAFYTDCVTKFEYDGCKLIADGLTIRFLLLVADTIVFTATGKHDKSILEVLDKVTKFEKRIKVYALNDNCDVDIQKAMKSAPIFVDNLLKIRKNEEKHK